MTEASTSPASLTGSSTPRRIAVIGGGISGLSAAFRLIERGLGEQPAPVVTLFEASPRCGGVFGSERVGDYLIERGADSFITNKPAGMDLCQRLGLTPRLIPTNARFRSSLILSKGRPVPTPAGFNLVAPGDLKAFLMSPLISWRGKLRVLAEPFIAQKQDDADESVADFVRRRLGKEALDALIQPLVGGIYTSDPERLSARTTLQRFVAMERNAGSLYRGLRPSTAPAESTGSVSGARYGLFVSFPQGMQELLNTLEARISSAGTIRCNTPIREIRQSNGGWELKIDDNWESFDGIILTLPAPAASQFLAPVHPECASTIGQIEYASSAIVLTGHALDQIQHPMESFGLVIPHREKRHILATSFLSRKFEGRAPFGRICLRTFVGGAMQPEELERTDEQIIQTVLSELRSIFGVVGKPDFAIVARYPRSMPQFYVGHLDRVREIRSLSGSLKRLTLAGNYFDGVGVPDCVQSGTDAADQLWSQLQFNGH